MKLFLFLILFIPNILSSQTDKINVNKITGESEGIRLFNSQQITFQNAASNDMMYIRMNDGTLDVYKIQEVNSIIIEGVSDVTDFISNIVQLDNYPNPFHESTNLTYTLESPASIEIKIFDISGTFVKTLVNEFQVTGKYTINWDGTNSGNEKVQSGCYYYQLKAEDTFITKQTILIK